MTVMQLHRQTSVSEWLGTEQVRRLLADTAGLVAAGGHPDPAAAWNLIRASFNAKKADGSDGRALSCYSGMMGLNSMAFGPISMRTLKFLP